MKGGSRKKPIVITLLIVVLTTMIIINEGQPSIVKSGHKEMKSQFDTVLPRLMKKYNVPGVAVALVKEGEVDWIKGYGRADVGNNKPVTGDTVFQVASNSKTLTAWGVMKLVESGTLDLDTPVEKYLTRWHLPITKYDNSKVTLRRVLSHTAGLSQGGYAGYAPDGKLPGLLEVLSGKVKGIPELRAVIEPGTKYKYSGGGYTLLQLIIEEVTGKPFERYMQEEILIPLGMKNSSYEWERRIQSKTARAYDVLGYPMPNYLYTEKAAAGLYTTAEDLARFVAANMNGGNGETAGRDIINKTSLAQMYKTNKKDYGFGYIIKKLPDGARLIYHGGSNRGWRSQFALLPKKSNGLVVLTNSENGANLHKDLVSLWVKWETGYWPDFYFKNMLLRIITKVIALILCLLLILRIMRTVKAVIDKKLLFIFRCKQFAVKDILLLITKCLLSVFIAVAWFILFYTGLLYNGWTFASFAPAGFTWATIDVFLWSIFLFIRCLFIDFNRLSALSVGLIKNKTMEE